MLTAHDGSWRAGPRADHHPSVAALRPAGNGVREHRRLGRAAPTCFATPTSTTGIRVVVKATNVLGSLSVDLGRPTAKIDEARSASPR